MNKRFSELAKVVRFRQHCISINLTFLEAGWRLNSPKEATTSVTKTWCVPLGPWIWKLSSKLSTCCHPSIALTVLSFATSLSIRASWLPAWKSATVILRATKRLGMKSRVRFRTKCGTIDNTPRGQQITSQPNCGKWSVAKFMQNSIAG